MERVHESRHWACDQKRRLPMLNEPATGFEFPIHIERIHTQRIAGFRLQIRQWLDDWAMVAPTLGPH